MKHDGEVQERPFRAPTPTLLAIVIGVSWFGGFMAGAIFLFTVVDATFLGSIGNYQINGRDVSADEALARVGAFLLAAAVYFPVLAWGLRKRRPWSRYAAIGYFFVVGVIVLTTSETSEEMVSGMVSISFVLIFSVWYFFRSRRVVAYFSGLELSHRVGGIGYRPTGLKLLAIFLGIHSIAGISNAVVIASGAMSMPLVSLPRWLGIVALSCGVAGGICAYGLWRLKAWSVKALMVWGANVLFFLASFVAVVPAHLFMGGYWGVALFVLIVGALFFVLYRYVLRTLKKMACHGAHAE